MSAPDIILLAGPTASGKSRLAMAIAVERDGVVINADSMQVYAELRVLTARPSADDEARVPHRLYGHVPASERYSVGRWLGEAAAAIGEARAAGRLPVVVGGTGLYFKALSEGLAAIPPVAAAVRARVRAEAAGIETAALHARLAAVDPEDAAALRPSDRARVLRALDVFTATGQSLAAWQRAGAEPAVAPATARRIVLAPEREALNRRIAARAEAIAPAALGEVRALLELGLADDLPAMKAIGVRELAAHLKGEVSLDEAVAAIAAETRRYAKRQLTWLRNQMGDWPRLGAAAALDLAGARA